MRTFRGQEVPLHWCFTVSQKDDLKDGQEIGFADMANYVSMISMSNLQVAAEVLIWSQGSVVSVSKNRP